MHNHPNLMNQGRAIEVKATIVSLARLKMVHTPSLVVGEDMSITIEVKNVGSEPFPEVSGRMAFHIDWLNGFTDDIGKIVFNDAGELECGKSVSLGPKKLMCIKDGPAVIKLIIEFSLPVHIFQVVNDEGTKLKISCMQDVQTQPGTNLQAVRMLVWEERPEITLSVIPLASTVGDLFICRWPEVTARWVFYASLVTMSLAMGTFLLSLISKFVI